MSEVECPYCGAEVEICHDDGHGMNEDELHRDECPRCEKSFVFRTMITISHEASKADCLNGGSHAWRPTATFPLDYTRMRCQTCDEERRPLPGEWELIRANAGVRAAAPKTEEPMR